LIRVSFPKPYLRDVFTFFRILLDNIIISLTANVTKREVDMRRQIRRSPGIRSMCSVKATSIICQDMSTAFLNKASVETWLAVEGKV